MRGLEGGKRFQHGEHLGGSLGGGAPQQPPGVALQEEDDRGFGGLIGILPEPGAVAVGGAEGVRHGHAQGRSVEGPGGGEARDETLGRGKDRGGAVRPRSLGLVGLGKRKGGARGDGGRRMGVVHGVCPEGAEGNDAGAARAARRSSKGPERRSALPSDGKLGGVSRPVDITQRSAGKIPAVLAGFSAWRRIRPC